ncbi:hypothetical protein [Halobacterium sp. CBA1126]|uniref:hypothetical protein n=1 Tax=Halobacterium TaxID=2239 RepID=UPI0012FB45DE|nr:hypothetical protein [Halobacterium sp. CBA1126]MUV59663.1 hypothetical protein [Halobacterium sp. CBA1126]
MGFDDLEAAEQDRSDRDDGADEQADVAAETADGEAEAPEPEVESVTDEEAPSADSSSEQTTTTEDDVSDQPAFEYGDVKQAPMYARPESWAALEDALDLDVVRTLREDGVRNEEKRELHDAVLRVAADHPDEIAEAVQRARREE